MIDSFEVADDDILAPVAVSIRDLNPSGYIVGVKTCDPVKGAPGILVENADLAARTVSAA